MKGHAKGTATKNQHGILSARSEAMNAQCSMDTGLGYYAGISTEKGSRMSLDKPEGKLADKVAEVDVLLKHMKSQVEMNRDIARELTARATTRSLKAILMQMGDANKLVIKLKQIAMDDEHPGQMQAMKMCMDRMIPVAATDKGGAGERPLINIQIMGLESKGLESKPLAIEGVSRVLD